MMSNHRRQQDKKDGRPTPTPTKLQAGGNPTDAKEMADARTQGHLEESVFAMTLSGDWKTGGIVEFLLGDQQLDFIKLAPGPWTVMANLFLAAIQSQLTHWQRAFVPTKRLIESLVAYDHGTIPDDQTVHRHINTIRSKLAATSVRKHVGYPHFSGAEWAMHVIQSSRNMGYRVGLSPSQLRLFIGDAEKMPVMAPGSDEEGRAKQKRSVTDG